MATAKELRLIYYDPGEFTKCLDEVKMELATTLAEPKKSELIALGAWCYYRRGEYAEAKKWAELASLLPFALECLAYIYAYAKGFKDDAMLREIIEMLGSNASVNVQNALTIRARDSDSTLTHEEVARGALSCRENTVEAANLFHNSARFFFAKSRSTEDLVMALGFLDVALSRYGADRNWHHRGAVHFWRSKILEQLFDKKAAIEAARESLSCWTQQRTLDPTNEQHRQQWENAVSRVRELIG